jgi:myo-inositol 2-dehydrogenase/D-chiro-inositol 1-dehydrogenase
MSRLESSNGVSRREFLKGAAATTAAVATFHIIRSASAQEAKPLKVGLIGCGGRGVGSARDAMRAAPNVKVVALADLFQDRVMGAREALNREGADIPESRCFVGFDAYKKLLETDVDIVSLCTPPGFRPQHFEAAINAGKHVFMEKPVAVDPVGCRRMFAAGKKADEKKLCVVAGTQRRHQKNYIDTIRRIKEGAIGQITSARAYWCQGELWSVPRRPEWSDVEWQIRNWLYFTWLSGDHIVEQHVHNLDVINWVMGTHPIRAFGMGGRQKRTDPQFGHIYDHFAVDYEYPGNVHMMSMCRQQNGTDGNVSEFVVGTKGMSDCASGIWDLSGNSIWRSTGGRNPYEQEWADLIEAIRTGKHINETQAVTESTLTAIMGRISAYTGKVVTWDQMMQSNLSLVPEEVKFGPMPVPPVAIPGQ